MILSRAAKCWCAGGGRSRRPRSCCASSRLLQKMITDVQLGICANILGIGIFMLGSDSTLFFAPYANLELIYSWTSDSH
ncbi:hypothetical protein ANCDUO_18512 [Ancylostoma duodenale]|uniref:Uncharacterized protein n=1 Tax=Ancylostoma duodenale TaxID=51022 RepID=A0A0C2C544_9BILA|nr:hypothetical protein ANCDUO_18512 [Ancylostoma duodenale]